VSRLIEWDGQPFAVLIETPDGDYLLPPVVLDEEGRPIEGREVLAAIVESEVSVKHPVVKGATPGDLAEIDQRMARISDELGVPLFPGESTTDA
jgi:hypothetical protein